MQSNGVECEEGVDAVIGRQPHLVESICEIWREFTDLHVEQVVVKRSNLQVDALDLRVAAAVRLLGPCDFSEKAHEISKSAAGEKVRFLRKLEIVLRELTACIVYGRRVRTRHLDVERQWNLPRDIAGVDRLRPHPLIGFRSNADGFHLDLIFRFLGQVITIESEGFAKRIE